MEGKKCLTQKKKALKAAEKKVEEEKIRRKRKRHLKKEVPAIKTAALTNKLMKELSTYYGLAILRHKDSVKDMRDAIWAAYYHKISTDAEPQHTNCPAGADSWCKYRQSEATNSLTDYKHPALSEEAKEILKPIYEDLTHDDLLERCLGGLTQNNNESFNSCVW